MLQATLEILRSVTGCMFLAGAIIFLISTITGIESDLRKSALLALVGGSSWLVVSMALLII